MKKIFIIGSVGKQNIGDDAICLSLIKILENSYKSKILLYVYAKGKYFKQNLNNEQKLQNLQFYFSSSLAENLKAFINSEFIILNGGDYIGDYGHPLIGIRSFMKLFILVLLAKFLLKKFLIINNGFWVTKVYGLMFLRIILRFAHCVSVRDSFSFNWASQCINGKLIKGFDNAVLLDDKCEFLTSMNKRNEVKIGFSVTPVFSSCFFNHKKDNDLAKVIAANVDMVLSNIKNSNFYFLAFSMNPKDGDLSIIEKIIQEISMKNKKRVEIIKYAHTISDFLSKFSQLDAIVCCKYHSIVFSYLFQKPMIVIGYHPKNATLVHDIMLSRRAYLSLEDVLDGKISQKLLELLGNPDQFRAKLPIYEAKRRALNGILNCIKHII